MSIEVPSMRDLIRAVDPGFKRAWVMRAIKYGEQELKDVENAVVSGDLSGLKSIGHYEAVADLLRILLIESKLGEYQIVTVFDPLDVFADPFIIGQFGPFNIEDDKLQNLKRDFLDGI